MDRDELDRLALLAAGFPRLRLLLLYGSRARGEGRADSDWDFGYVAEPDFDADAFRLVIADTVRSDAVDLVDLERAGGLLRFRAARDGRVVYESTEGEFARFWTAAVQFYCDAEPVLTRSYQAILERLGP